MVNQEEEFDCSSCTHSVGNQHILKCEKHGGDAVVVCDDYRYEPGADSPAAELKWWNSFTES